MAAPEYFFVTLFLPLLVLIAVFLLKEKKMKRLPFRDALQPIRRCFAILMLPNMRWFLVILLVASISSTFGIPFFFYLKENLHFRETFLGLLSSIGWGGALLGSLVYVKWLRRASPKKTLRWALFFNALNIFGTLFIRDTQSAVILVFAGGVMGCLVLIPIMASAALLTHRSGVEGTLFASLMSLFNLGQIAFGYLGGKIYPFVGLQTLILVTGLAALTGLGAVQKLKFS